MFSHDLLIILPSRRTALPGLIQKVLSDPGLFKKLFMKSLYLEEAVRLLLPTFSFETSVACLKESLIKMGISSAFDSDSTKFGNLTASQPFTLSEIFHKVAVQVDVSFNLE